MKWLLSILFAALLMGAGRVQTRDAKTLEGEVSLSDATVIVHGAAGGDTRIAWDEIARLSLRAMQAVEIEMARAGATLPDGWKNQDIGNVKFPGAAACDAKGDFTINASGWGAWGAKDSLHFTACSLEGDGQIIAHVARLDNAHGPVVAGVMIRQSLAPDAPMAGTCLYPSGEVRLTRRPVGPAHEFKRVEDAAPQSWVRLTRAGDTISGFRSTDGKYWQLVDTRKVPMERSVLIGVAAWTTGNAWLGSAQIDSVRIVPGTPGLSYFPGGDALAQGIVLRDGNILAATIVGIHQAGVHFDHGGKSSVLPREQVARLIFSPVPPDFAAPRDKSGILLTSGDFIEGDVTALSLQPVEWPRKPQLKATVRSVLFGARSFETAKEVIAVDLSPLTPVAAAYEVRMTDGSLKRAKSVTIVKEGVIVDGQKVADVIDVRRL